MVADALGEILASRGVCAGLSWPVVGVGEGTGMADVAGREAH